MTGVKGKSGRKKGSKNKPKEIKTVTTNNDRVTENPISA